MVLDKLTNDLKLVIRSNIKVSLHSFFNSLRQILRFDFQFDLERETLEQGQLAAEVV